MLKNHSLVPRLLPLHAITPRMTFRSRPFFHLLDNICLFLKILCLFFIIFFHFILPIERDGSHMILKLICYIFGTKMTTYCSGIILIALATQNFASMIHQGLPLTRPKEIDIEKSHFLFGGGGSRVIRGISMHSRLKQSL